MRFYDVDSGRILIDGKDVRSYDDAKLREKFGVVLQNDFLMAASVRENIDFERGLSDVAIERAAEYAKADTFIAEHGGYESLLTARGANFSGGQKQRLAIARAVCRKPEIYIFDDCFSALDYKTDKLLREALRRETGNTTSLIVAQRIGTIRDADLIVVLDEGNVVGKGTHDELMRSCEVYREIAYSQLSEEELGVSGEVKNNG